MPTRQKDLRRALDTTRRWVRTERLWHPGDVVLLACSGGTDSTAAAGLLGELAASLGHKLALGYVEHGLRPGAREELAAVRQLAERLHAPLFCATLSLKDGPDLQARARKQRYQALEALRRDANAGSVATAHHADDQAETVLMRACRGAGIDGLRGIRTKRGHIVRPFLPLSQAALHAGGKALGFVGKVDPSNRQPRFTRNRMRHEALPLLEEIVPGASRGLARTAASMSAASGVDGHWLQLALTHLASEETIDDRVVSLRFPREDMPADIGELARWQLAVARRMGAVQPSRRAAEQLFSALHATNVNITTCRTSGLRWTISSESVSVEAPDVARGMSAD